MTQTFLDIMPIFSQAKAMFRDKSNPRAEEKAPYAYNGTEKFIPCYHSNHIHRL